ncbi:MAG: hypothetical protein IH790_07105 [Acidobacteria bacterium]|nr:hypothetical protein [Acidobacteriota bacterium]
MLKCKSVACIAITIIVALPSAILVPTDGWAQIEEIVVTARRREENLQEVPLAVQVFGREEVLRKGINTVADGVEISCQLSAVSCQLLSVHIEKAGHHRRGL